MAAKKKAAKKSRKYKAHGSAKKKASKTGGTGPRAKR